MSESKFTLEPTRLGSTAEALRELESLRAKPLPMSKVPPSQFPDEPTTFVERAGLRLHSAFQPIISVVHSKVVGHEALVRGRDQNNRSLSPAELFPLLVATLSERKVNETCSRLHLESFVEQGGKGWLFLNFTPDAVSDRAGIVAEFGNWIQSSGLSPSQVVVEIVETRTFDEKLLAAAVSGFRDLGCLVAIDDFGAGHSNFERVWRLRPDIVKLDRAMITEAAHNPLVERILPGIVSLVHEAGCLVVMEGIETERQAFIAVESDVDFVQGFYFSRPQARYAEGTDLRPHFESLSTNIRATHNERTAFDQEFLSRFTGQLEDCVSLLDGGLTLQEATASFLRLANVQRVYELDAQGYQIGDNIESPTRRAPDPRFSPCEDANGANWYRRPYFQQAIAKPGHVQVSRPYLSIRDASSCVTMSLGFIHDTGLRILCADLDHGEARGTCPRSLRQTHPPKSPRTA
jgi:EAL domain-containing protein (putative c-di-GMP-specific phosphodiesterase class I)